MQTRTQHTEKFATLNKTFLVWITHIHNETSNFEVLIMRSVNMGKFVANISSLFYFPQFCSCLVKVCKAPLLQFVSNNNEWEANGGICTNHENLIDPLLCVHKTFSWKAPLLCLPPIFLPTSRYQFSI